MLTTSATVTHNGASSLNFGNSLTTGTDLGAITLTLDGTGTTQYEGGINEASGTSLSLVIDGGNHYTNSASTLTGLTINGGTIFLRGSNQVASAGTINFNGGGFASFGSGRSHSNNFIIGGDVAFGGDLPTVGNIVGGGASASTISGTVDLGGAVRAINVIDTATFSGVVSNGGITKNGGALLVLSNTNTYTGLTTVNAGELRLDHATDTLSGDITVSGGTLNVNNPDTVGAVTLTSGTISGDSTLTGTSYAVESGTIGIPLAGSGAALTKTTSGIVLITNSGSSYAGGTVLNAGKIGLRSSGAPLGTGTVTINGGAIGSVVSTRSLSNNILITNDFQFGGINAPGLGNSGTTFNGDVDLGGATRTISLADGTTINGDISNGGLTLNATSSNRTLTIGATSVSTYTGPTTMNVGGLFINGDLSAATGAINLTSGATLGGNGTSGGAVVMAPNTGLSARITDWTGAAGVGYEDLAVASLDAGGGALKLVVTTTGLTNFTETNKSFTILNAAGGISGFNPANVTITTTSFPGTGTWALAQVGTSLVLKYTGDDPYQEWIASHSVADESMGGDSDNDGITNLLEFVLNGDPGKSDTAILPDGALSDTNFAFSYVRLTDSTAVPQVVQYGSDLSEWTHVAIPTFTGTTTVGDATVIVGEPASGVQTVTVRIPPSEPATGKLFGRLKVGP